VEIALDVIVVSELFIKLETVAAILIFLFIVFILATKVLRTRRARQELIQAYLAAKNVGSDNSAQDANADRVSGYSLSSEGQQELACYDHQLLDHALVQMRLNQNKLPQWQIQLSKAQARIKEDTKEALLLQKFGYINPDIACPYCDELGKLRTKYIEQDKVSDASKVSAAMASGGSSSDSFALTIPKQTVQAHCGSCGRVWTF
jgi:hypothetical protein